MTGFTSGSGPAKCRSYNQGSRKAKRKRAFWEKGGTECVDEHCLNNVSDKPTVPTRFGTCSGAKANLLHFIDNKIPLYALLLRFLEKSRFATNFSRCCSLCSPFCFAKANLLHFIDNKIPLYALLLRFLEKSRFATNFSRCCSLCSPFCFAKPNLLHFIDNKIPLLCLAHS